jgi:hypothetical protein
MVSIMGARKRPFLQGVVIVRGNASLDGLRSRREQFHAADRRDESAQVAV